MTNGKLDAIYPVANVDASVCYFRKLGANVKHESTNFGHIWPTNLSENPSGQCYFPAVPLPLYCDSEKVGSMLRHIVPGEIKGPVPQGTWGKYGEYKTINTGDRHTSMLKTSKIYIPHNCKDGIKRCRLHVFLHGCEGAQDKVGDKFNTRMGLLEYAASNDIVVFFPSTRAASPMTFAGPLTGCWDVFGLTDINKYWTSSNIQASRIIDMVNELKSWQPPPASLVVPNSDLQKVPFKTLGTW